MKYKVYASYKNSTTREFEADSLFEAAQKYAIKEHKDPKEVYYLKGNGGVNNPANYHINNWGNIFVQKLF